MYNISVVARKFLKSLKIKSENDFVYVGPEPSSKERKMNAPESSIRKKSKRDASSYAPESSTRKKSRRDASSCARDHARTNPGNYKVHVRKDGSFESYDPKFQKGTTAMAFIFEEGIMVAVDHSSQSSKSAKNVVELNSHMLATITGGSESLLKKVHEKCYLQEQKERRKTTVKEALEWLAETVSANTEELSIGILVAVVNESERGLYCMNSKGTWVKGDVLATGSGSYASVIVQTQRKCGMSVTEAAELAKRTICIAAYRAPQSGDIATVYHLGSGGCKKVLEDDMEEWQKANIKSPRWKFEVIGKGW